MSEHTTDLKAALRDAESKVRSAEARMIELNKSLVKTAVWSGVGGFLLFAVGAHWFPGYQLDSTAARTAKQEAGQAVNELMAQLCAERFLSSSEVLPNLKALDEESGRWEKATFIRDGSWAVNPNGDRPDMDTAERCSELIAAHVPAQSPGKVQSD